MKPAFTLRRVLPLPPKPGNPRNSEGGFVTLRDGRILFVYTRYYGESWDDHAPAELAARISTDGGRSYLPDERIIVPNEGRNVMSVSLLRLADGRIALVYLRKSGGDACDCRPYLRTSSDEGESWSAPADIIGLPGYFVVNNDRLIQLSSGRLLLPAAFHRYCRNAQGRVEPGARGIVLFYASDDGGASWRELPEWILPPRQLDTGFQEPGAVELADGRIFACFRTGDGAQYTARSEDGGEHWSDPVRNEAFPSPAAPLSMKRNPSTGELFAVWDDLSPERKIPRTPESWNRTPLVLARSSDGGKSWHGHIELENAPDHGYCYTAMHFTGDALLLGYCSGGGTSGVLQTLTLARLEYRSEPGGA